MKQNRIEKCRKGKRRGELGREEKVEEEKRRGKVR